MHHTVTPRLEVVQQSHRHCSQTEAEFARPAITYHQQMPFIIRPYLFPVSLHTCFTSTLACQQKSLLELLLIRITDWKHLPGLPQRRWLQSMVENTGGLGAEHLAGIVSTEHCIADTMTIKRNNIIILTLVSWQLYSRGVL